MSTRQPAGTVRLPWTVGAVLLLVLALGLVLLTPARGTVDPGTVAAQRDGAQQLAAATSAQLQATAARLTAAAALLPAEATGTDLDALLATQGLEGVQLAPSTGAGTTAGRPVPAPRTAVTPPVVYWADGLVVQVPAGAGASLSALVPTAGLVPDWVALVGVGEAALLGEVPVGAEALLAAAQREPVALLDGGTVLAAAPLSGAPGGPGWVVLTSTPVGVSTPGRTPFVLAGLLLALLVLLVFGWLDRALLRPLGRLSVDAQRLALGELDEPVRVGRLDEIGRTAQGLERARVALVRKDVRENR